MLKKLKMRVLPILLSIFLGFNAAAAPALTVQANPALWGIYELIIALAVSAGVSVSSYNISQGLSSNAEAELKETLITAMPDWLKLYTTGAELTQNMIADGTLQTELEALAVGETYDMDGIGIVKKDESSYALSMGAEIVKGVAEQIDAWAESEANDVVMDVEVDYSSYVGSNVDIPNYSFDDLITNYSQVLYDAITADGWTEDNCCLLVYQFSSGASIYNEFLVIPHGYTFINNVFNYNYTSSYSSGMQVVDTDIFFDIFRANDVGMNNYDIRNFILNNNYDFPVYTYHFASNSMVPFLEVSSNAVYEAKIQDFGSTNSNVYKDMEYVACYGFSDAVSTHILHTLDCACLISEYEQYYTEAIKTMFPTVAAKYLNKTLDTTVDLEENKPITMDITEDTLPGLEGTESLTQYITYVTEQSIDLQALQDTIVEAEQNSAITIKDAIEGQTKSLLDGLWDVIAGTLSDVFVPDTEYWSKEMELRVETVSADAGVLFMSFDFINYVFDILTNYENVEIGDFILTIPDIEFEGVMLFKECSFNVSEFFRTPPFDGLYELYIITSDVIIVCLIANYTKAKLKSIFMKG